MRTLLERAKPELLAGMELMAKKQPNSVEYAKKFLSENCWAHHITWHIWVDLRSWWLAGGMGLADNPWEVFED